MNANTIAMTEMITCWSSSNLTPLEMFDFIVQRLWGYYVGIGWKGFDDLKNVIERGLGNIVFVELFKRLSGRKIWINLLRQVPEKFTYLAVPDCEINIFVE